MADIYLSNFGDYWSNGFSINAVELASDGWTFFAGGSGAQQNQNLTLWAYKDGALQWQKDIWAMKLTVRDTYRFIVLLFSWFLRFSYGHCGTSHVSTLTFCSKTMQLQLQCLNR